MDVSQPETIGERIRRERRNVGATQQRLAAEVGVTGSHLSKIETGRESPSGPLLRRLAGRFGCDYRELMLAARRMPDDVLDRVLAAGPAAALRRLRDWQPATDRDACRDGRT